MFCSRRSRGDLNILPNLFCFVNTFFYFFQKVFIQKFIWAAAFPVPAVSLIIIALLPCIVNTFFSFFLQNFIIFFILGIAVRESIHFPQYIRSIRQIPLTMDRSV